MSVQQRRTRFGFFLALLWCCTAGAAHALTLADLVGGGSFQSGNGQLTFSDFELVVAGVLSPDPGAYTIEIQDTGFRIAGDALQIAAGEAGDLLLQYRVTTAPGSSIERAALSFQASVLGAGSLAAVAEDLFSVPGSGDPLGSLAVGVSGGGFSQTSDEVFFTGFPTELLALKDIQLIATQGAGDVSIASVDQSFATQSVPEPGLALLFLSGGAAILVARKRRQQA